MVRTRVAGFCNVREAWRAHPSYVSAWLSTQTPPLPPSPGHTPVQLVDPGLSDAVPLPQSRQDGRGTRLEPPSEYLPGAHMEQAEPP